MNRDQCPICFSELEKCQTAPCYRCGVSEMEIQHWKDGIHRYSENEMFGQRIVLCDYCLYDFCSENGTFYGLTSKTAKSWVEIRPEMITHCKSLDQTQLISDKYCSECEQRFAFLRFLEQARLHNQKKDIEFGSN